MKCHLVLAVQVHLSGLTLGCLDVLDLADHSLSVGAEGFTFLVHLQPFLLQLVEVFKFSLPFPKNQHSLGFVVDFVRILRILLEVHVPVLGQSEGRQHANLVASVHAAVERGSARPLRPVLSVRIRQGPNRLTVSCFRCEPLTLVVILSVARRVVKHRVLASVGHWSQSFGLLALRWRKVPLLASRQVIVSKHLHLCRKLNQKQN